MFMFESICLNTTVTGTSSGPCEKSCVMRLEAVTDARNGQADLKNDFEEDDEDPAAVGLVADDDDDGPVEGRMSVRVK